MTEGDKLDWWMSFRLTRDMRDLIADYALKSDKAKGSPSKMVRLMIGFYIESSGVTLNDARTRAAQARYLTRRRLGEIESLRQHYQELKASPNAEEEQMAQARAEELGVKWPPDPYSEADLSTVLSRLQRLWHTDDRYGLVTFRALHNSLRRRYNQDRLFGCLKELESRDELRISRTHPVEISEVL